MPFQRNFDYPHRAALKKLHVLVVFLVLFPAQCNEEVVRERNSENPEPGFFLWRASRFLSIKHKERRRREGGRKLV